MAWYDRIVRSVSGVISPKPWLINLFGGNATLAGENVSSTNAPKVSALYACVNLIGNTIASLPWQLFRETEQGTFVFDRQWEIAGWAGQSLDNKPYIAAGADGRVWVTDPEGFRVLCFDKNGGFLFTWGDFGRDAARFELPVGVAVDDEGNVWIVDTDTSRVLKFTPPVEGS